MSKALEAAANQLPDTFIAGDRMILAQAAILAFLREADTVELGAAVRDAEDPTHVAIARALVKALARLAEGD